MEKIIISGAELTINYQETKIGDMVVDKNSNNVYKADIADADDLNWIVIPSRASRIEAARNIAGEIYNLYCNSDNAGSWELNKATDAMYAYIRELEESPPKH